MERLKRIRSDYQQFQTDQQELSQLLGGRSRQLQWQQYNLTGVSFVACFLNKIDQCIFLCMKKILDLGF